MQNQHPVCDSNITKESLYYLFDKSFEACRIAGQHKEISDADKLRQLTYIKSEVQELEDAVHAQDLVEQLDACVDILVTVFGFMQKLESQGAMLAKSMLKTADNNLSKFPTDREIAEKSVGFYESQKKITCTIHYDPVTQRYVIRDSQGKYRKPFGFVENDLSDCFIGKPIGDKDAGQ